MRAYNMSFYEIDELPLLIALDIMVVGTKLNGKVKQKTYIDDIFK